MKRSARTDPKPLASMEKSPLAPPCPDFAELIKKSATGRSLFEQIASCFSDRLEAFARYYCRSDALGQDAFQEAMIAMMTYFDTYRGDAPIEPWLRRIVTSACSRLRRGKKNDPLIHQAFEDGHLTPRAAGADTADSAPSQELRLMLAQQLEVLRQELDRLKEPNRTMLLLHDGEEIPIAELASRFHMTEESVKSRLKRSRALIRDQILKRS